MRSITNEEIVKLAQGDRRTQNKLYKDLYYFTLWLCDEDEDVANIVLQKAFMEVNEVYAVEQFMSLIKLIAKQRNIDTWKCDSVRKKHIPAHIESFDDNYFEFYPEEDDNYSLIYNAVEDLSDRQKEVILLYLQGFLLKDIAIEMGLNTQTVKTLYRRAKQNLKKVLKKDDFF